MAEEMTRRRVLVTGATGLIGRAVTHRLIQRGDDVVAVVRPQSTTRFPSEVTRIELDLAQASAKSLATLGPLQAVIHLAQAPGWHDFPKHAGQVAALSVAATAHLAEAAVEVGADTFVLASSGGIYGPSDHPIAETTPIKPAADLGFYLATKAAAEQMLQYFEKHLRIHILRPFFVYGAGQNETFLMPRLVRSIRDGLPIRLEGGTGPLINPIHVEDAAAAFTAALDLPQPLVSNIAGPEIVSIREIADLLAALLGRAPIFSSTDGKPGNFVADTTRMVTQLGPAPTGVKSGLAGLALTNPNLA